MAKVGAQRAAELTGRSKSTIQRAMKSGKLSYEVDANGRRVIDTAELDRAFGLKPQETEQKGQENVQAELEKATRMLEMERMKMRIKMLEDQLEVAQAQIEDLKDQREQWQKQAQQVLLTSQYSQKQAETLQAELKEREERARLNMEKRRQMEMERRAQMQKGAKPGVNQNNKPRPQGPISRQLQEKAAVKKFDMNGLWNKIRGDSDNKAQADVAAKTVASEKDTEDQRKSA